MNKKTIKTILLTIAVVPLLGFGQSAIETESETYLHAKEILQKMSNYLSSADQFSFKAEMTEDGLFTKDYYTKAEVRTEVIIRRPDKVFADIKSDYNHKRYWYDGNTITLLTVPANFYATVKATGNIGEMADFVYDNLGVRIPLAALAFDNSFEVLTEGVTDGYYCGLHVVDGIYCHHLLFIEDDAEWEIWIEDGSNTVPRKYVIKYDMDDREYHFSATINDWDFNRYTPDELFNFTPPSGASVIEFVK